MESLQIVSRFAEYQVEILIIILDGLKICLFVCCLRRTVYDMSAALFYIACFYYRFSAPKCPKIS